MSIRQKKPLTPCGNDMVRRFIDKANQFTRDEIEQLIAGEAVVKEINQELTYRELDDSIDNVWSVLLRSRGDWLTKSNPEMGEGYSDILICTPDRTGIIIEVKYGRTAIWKRAARRHCSG